VCLRFVFLLVTRTASWLRLSEREETWKSAEILLLRHQLAVLQGERRRKNLAYHRVWRGIRQARQRGHRQERALTQPLRRMPSQGPDGPGYRRLRYVRYCDDFLLGFAKITGGRRMVNGTIGLFVPRTAIRERCARYMSKGVPAQRGPLLSGDDFTIVATYGSEYRGHVQVLPAGSVTKMARKYKTRVATDSGPWVCFQVTVPRDGREPLVARSGGIPLKRQPTAIINDRKPPRATTQGNELICRLLAGRCELCTSRTGLQVHHVRKLADLDKPGAPRTTGVGPPDGQAQTQDPRGLPTLPP
jgi:hypothetical protein